MKTSYRLFLTTVTAASIISFAPSVSAQSYGSNTYYPPSCIFIDQMVSNPAITKSIEYVDNISPSDVKFQPGATVIARVKIKNSASISVQGIKITNTIPQYMSYFSGPGSLSSDGKVLTIDAGDLQPGEEKFFYITYKTASAESLPADKSVICVPNVMSAQGTACNRDEDTSQICIEKSTATKGGVNPVYQQQLQAVKTAPKAGPELGIVFLGLNAFVGAFGLALKRRSV
jgi:hypothetical protein